jgi:hypothetical protein
MLVHICSERAIVRQGVIRAWDGSADLAIPIGNCMKKQQVKIFQSVSTMLHQHDMGATQYDQVSRFACDATITIR